MLILGGISLVLLYFFQIYFLAILVGIIGIFWLRARIHRLRKIRAWNDFKIPAEVWRVFKQRHPNIATSSYAYIEEGFKDYLAIHLLRKDAYAMPSHSVDALWHVLIEEFDTFYRTMCLNFLGYELIHQPHDPLPTEAQRASQKKTIAQYMAKYMPFTWFKSRKYSSFTEIVSSRWSYSLGKRTDF
jgi:hypothetical protein